MIKLLLADIDGTLINESISTSAGASYGQFMNPREIRRLIVDAGRIPAQRDTIYRILKIFNGVEDDSPVPLEGIAQDTGMFGSFADLISDERFRFRRASA